MPAHQENQEQKVPQNPQEGEHLPLVWTGIHGMEMGFREDVVKRALKAGPSRGEREMI